MLGVAIIRLVKFAVVVGDDNVVVFYVRSSVFHVALVIAIVDVALICLLCRVLCCCCCSCRCC